MPFRRVVPAGVLACALAAPAAAHAAPSLGPWLPATCPPARPRSSGRPVRLVAGGFTPNALIDVAVDGERVAGVAGTQVAGPDGPLQGSIPAPYRRRGERRFTVTLAEQGTPANTVTAASRITALAVSVRPRQAVPDPGGPLRRARLHRPRPRVRTLRLPRDPAQDRLDGPAEGRVRHFRARRRQIPVRPRRGVWLVQSDQQRTFTDPPESIFVRLQIRVFPQAA